MGFDGEELQRVDWEEGDLIGIPLWAWHQHFNDSDTEPARYLAIQDTFTIKRWVCTRSSAIRTARPARSSLPFRTGPRMDAMTEVWRSVERLERADFYADWLAASERNASIVERSPIVARGRDLVWIETPNEHRLAMLIGEQTGFPTNGTNLCQVVVPAGTHTGRHRHGEEAIHVLRGSGLHRHRRPALRRPRRHDRPRPVHERPPGVQHRRRRPRVRLGLDHGPRPVHPSRAPRAARGEGRQRRPASRPRCRPRTASSTRSAGASPCTSRTRPTRPIASARTTGPARARARQPAMATTGRTTPGTATDEAAARTTRPPAPRRRRASSRATTRTATGPSTT